MQGSKSWLSGDPRVAHLVKAQPIGVQGVIQSGEHRIVSWLYQAAIMVLEILGGLKCACNLNSSLTV